MTINIYNLIKKLCFSTDSKQEPVNFLEYFFSYPQISPSAHNNSTFIIQNNLGKSYVELCMLFRIFITLSASVTSAEPVMSYLKFIKSYFQALVSNRKLNDFGT